MRRIKIKLGGVMMFLAMLISGRGELIALYLLAALIHELGHLIAARLLKIGVERIEIGASGVRICVCGGGYSYLAEMLLAFAGPLANLIAISGVLTVAKCMGHQPRELLSAGLSLVGEEGGGILSAAGFFLLSSAAQAILNLIPIKSFDGGRILRCAAMLTLEERWAERICGAIEGILVFCLWSASLYLMLRASTGLGLFTLAVSMFFCIAEEK